MLSLSLTLVKLVEVEVLVFCCEYDCFHCSLPDCLVDDVTEADRLLSDSLEVDALRDRSRFICSHDKTVVEPLVAEKRHNYYLANRDKIIAYQKARYQARRDELLAYQRLRYYANRDELIAYQKEYERQKRQRKKLN